MTGDFLICEYVVKLPSQFEVTTITSVETSVIFITEGKGEEDIGVHFFERRNQQSLTSDTFRQPQRISTVLPASPLSYDGEIVKIKWSVRVRLFIDDGNHITEDKFFRLGTVESFGPLKTESKDNDAE
ncbi:MAG: hypothetical protein AB8B55_24655 [Mariniblastus sp.]